MARYSAFFFPTTREAVQAALDLQEMGVKIKTTRIPSALTGVNDRCTLGIITTDSYRDCIAGYLNGEHPDYRIFDIDSEKPSDSLKPFVEMWDKCKW